MPVTRRPARSSFTLEVKRANRQTPEVLTRSKTSAAAATPLADQVFGKSAGRSRTQKSDRSEAPASVPRKPILGTNLPEATKSSEKASPQRILPDLLTADVNPVKERLHREAEGRSNRRSTSRSEQAKNEETRPATKAQGTDVAPAPVKIDATTDTQPWREAVIPSSGSVENTEQVSTSRKRKSNTPVAAYKRAKRGSQSVPQFAAGQRWKRRLPKACW